MKNSCLNCNETLEIEHTFCPHCGFDLREIDYMAAKYDEEFGLNSKDLEGETNSPQKSDVNPVLGIPYWKTTLWGLISIIVIYALHSVLRSAIVSGGGFDMNLFATNVIGFGFWLIVIPLIISLFFNKTKRRNAYKNGVIWFIVLTSLPKLLAVLL